MQKQDVYRVFENETVHVSLRCTLWYFFFFFLGWSMMATHNSIKAGYKVYEVQKVDEI